MRPRKVLVSPHTFEVKVDNAACDAMGANGYCATDTNTIMLSDANADSQVQETLLHECLHAIWSQTRLGIHWPDRDEDSPGEQIIQSLTPRLLALLKDNPKLVEYLLGGS